MKKKILFILHTPPPIHGSSVMGGIIKNSKIINELYDCVFINLSTSITISETGKKGIVKYLRYISILVKVIIQVVFNRPNICYLSLTSKGLAFYKDFIIILIIKLFSINIVYHFHNKGVKTRQDYCFDDMLYRFAFNNADVILLSRYLYPDIQKYKSINSIYYCPNGVRSGGNCINIHENTKIVNILFLSNLIKSKGVFVLIDACKILRDNNIQFNCSFIGGIGDVSVQTINNYINKFELSTFVHYDGQRFDAQKEAVFSNADIFVLPTFYHNECFPLVLLEAMQHSIPVVSTYEGGIPDIVEDGVTGYLIQQNNSIALADKLEKLINNPKLRKDMGILAREKYEKTFTLNHFEDNISNILNMLLKK